MQFLTWEVLWFISIFLTILIWGTWLIFSRKVATEIWNPFFENLLITLWALICNILIFVMYILYSGDIFDVSLFLLPFLSGILWAFAGLFAFISISKIGVGKAMSIWAPSWMIVSFLWGVLYYKEFSWNIFLLRYQRRVVVLLTRHIRNQFQQYSYQVPLKYQKWIIVWAMDYSDWNYW